MPVRLLANGPTLQELFQDASHQLLSLLIDPSDVSEAIREKIVLEAPDPSALLKMWIDSLLSLVNHQQIIFLRIRFLELQELDGLYRLKAEVTGELIDPLRHTFRQPPHRLQVSEVRIASQAGQNTAHILLL